MQTVKAKTKAQYFKTFLDKVSVTGNHDRIKSQNWVFQKLEAGFYIL